MYQSFCDPPDVYLDINTDIYNTKLFYNTQIGYYFPSRLHNNHLGTWNPPTGRDIFVDVFACVRAARVIKHK